VLGYRTCFRMSIKEEHTPKGISKGASEDKGWGRSKGNHWFRGKQIIKLNSQGKINSRRVCDLHPICQLSAVASKKGSVWFSSDFHSICAAWTRTSSSDDGVSRAFWLQNILHMRCQRYLLARPETKWHTQGPLWKKRMLETPVRRSHNKS